MIDTSQSAKSGSVVHHSWQSVAREVKGLLLVNPGTLVMWTDCHDITLSVLKISVK